MMKKRRFFVPEVIQTSAMDCGPAALKALLDGCGIPVHYGRLREVCQTDVDGTSIDTLEEVAGQLGLDAQQIILPADHLLEPSAAALPAVAVVRLPNGATHFVVVWRRTGSFVQVMDPGSGRRWKRKSQFVEELYRHTTAVPAAGWREWAGGDEFTSPLRARLSALRFNRDGSERLVNAALADEGWFSLGRLDAACRCVTALVDAGVLRRGAAAGRLCRALAGSDDALKLIPASFWSVRPAGGATDDTLMFRGAVVVRAKGLHPHSSPPAPDAEQSWVSRVRQPDRASVVSILKTLRDDGLLDVGLHISLSVITAIVLLIQAMMFRGLIDLVTRLSGGAQLVSAAAALLFLSIWLIVQRIWSGISVLRYGRVLAMRLRVAFLQKVPRLGERYFRSRLTADMAERAHTLDNIRRLPVLGGRIVSSFVELVATVAALIWIAPASAPWAIAAGAASLLVPLAFQPVVGERDLRVRAHVGALSRFYLDAMIGLIPLRVHAAEPSFRREQENLLREWVRSSVSLLRATVTADALQAAGVAVATAGLLIDHLWRGYEPGSTLLVVYWALSLPYLGTFFATALRQYPSYRNIFLRATEPLGAPDGEPAPVRGDVAVFDRGVSIRFSGVSVEAGGHEILRDIDLAVEAGEHVAIVGPSGAGKSTLVGVLLGWYRPAAGSVAVSGVPFTEERMVSLREVTAWVDPAIHLWNRSLIDNIVYGVRDFADLHAILDQTQLISVLDHLPDGLQSELGEGGGLVSGGEGQRVRLARAFSRRNARLVILDEPFRGLDRERRHELLQRARRHWSEATLLCITHDIEETRDFERVLVMESGRIVESVRPADASADSRYRDLLEREASVHRDRWGHPSWRRVHIDREGLHEQP